MIIGHVRDNMPRTQLEIAGPDGGVTIECIIDTAFDGELSLPANVIRSLNIPFSFIRRARLADGSHIQAPCYEVEIEWGGDSRYVRVVELDGAPLLGVELLSGYFVQIEMNDGGDVTIEEL